MLERRDLAAFDDEHASAALVTRAKIATEHGHYADAEADYLSGGRTLPQKSAADTTCFWLHAETEIYGYLDPCDAQASRVGSDGSDQRRMRWTKRSSTCRCGRVPQERWA